MTVRVVVVDDHHLVRSGLRSMLEVHDDLEVVGEAGDGQEALAVARETRPDVVVMDVRMPRMDGIEATRRLRAGGPGATGASGASGARAPQVLVLTTFDLDEYVYEALRAGAAGFMLKDAPPSQLAEAVRTVAAAEDAGALLAPAVTRRLVERHVVRRAAPAPEQAAALQRLTEREHEVLRHLARGLSNSEIAAEMFVGETTVKTHLTHLLAKLGLRDRVQAVVFAYECGVVEPGST